VLSRPIVAAPRSRKCVRSATRRSPATIRKNWISRELLPMLHEQESRSAAATDTKDWWKRPYRMVQTNLRQLDALYDQKALAREVKAFGADVLLYNIGG